MNNNEKDISREIELTRLPDTEFEVMSVIWRNDPPVTTSILMDQLGNIKGWKLQTLTTLLNRLIDREFLRSEKLGKERNYYPTVNEEDYIHLETTHFVKRYHNNSICNLVSTFCDNTKLEKQDIAELSAWLKSMEDKI